MIQTECVGLCQNCDQYITHQHKWEIDDRDGIIHQDCKVYQDIPAWIKMIEDVLKEYMKDLARQRSSGIKRSEEIVKAILLILFFGGLLK